MNIDNPIIAAVRSGEELTAAMESPVDTIFLLKSSILTIKRRIDAVHENGKSVFIHVDLMDGLGKDEDGIAYLAKCGADGIISTRMNMITIAKNCNLKNVQRFFMVDSHSVDTAARSAAACLPDMIEIMPGVVIETIKKMCRLVSVPIIAGGLVENKKQVMAALEAGASAVSTGKSALWSV